MTGRIRNARRLHWRRRFSQEWAGVLMLLFVLGAIGVIAVAHGSAAPALDASELRASRGSELWMDGTSTLHDWECRTSDVQVDLRRAKGRPEPEGAAALEALIRANGIESLEVAIALRTLHSDRKGLEKNMLKSLQSDKYPVIHFRMLRYSVVSAEHADTLALRLEGALIISGVKKDVMLAARAWKGANGEWVDGSETLLMSDYGIKPPRMMLGTLKVADRVVIHYHLLLAPPSGVVGIQVPAGTQEVATHASH